MFFVLPTKLIFWYAERLVPRYKNKWVFGSWFGEKYNDNSRAMYEYVLREMPQIRPIWLTKNIDIYNRLKQENKPVAKLNSLSGILAALTSKIAFITVEREEVNGFFLNGAKLVWLYHGMVIKQIMEDEKRFVHGANYGKMGVKDRFFTFLCPYSRKLDVSSVLVTGEFFSPFFATAFNVDSSKIWKDGYPRNDELFSNKQEPIIQVYREKFPNAKFIIHMPTHRIHGLNGRSFNPFEGFGFDKDCFLECLERGNYVFFYKGHFYDSEGKQDIDHERFIRITDSDFDNLYHFVKDMDILITDYSSIYFDFLLLKKPIILTPFDYQEYITHERPLYYDYHKTIEGNIANDWRQVFNMLLEESYSIPSDESISKFHAHIDGNSANRIAQHVLNQWF